MRYVGAMKNFLSQIYRYTPAILTNALAGLLHPKFCVSVAGVYVTADGRVLLARHVYRRHYPWGLPGGFLAAGEAPEAGALRELREETGLVACVDRVVSAGAISRRHLEIVVVGTIDPAQPARLNHEIFEIGFFTPGTLPAAMPPDQHATVLRLMRHPSQSSG